MLQELLNSKTIRSKVTNHITFGRNHFEDLNSKQKDELISLCIDEVGLEAMYCLDDNSDEILNNFKKCIVSGKENDAKSLFDAMRKSALSYYEYYLVDIFDSIEEEVSREVKIRHGLRPIRYVDNGEIAWIR